MSSDYSNSEDWEHVSEKIAYNFWNKLYDKIRELDVRIPELPEGFLLDPGESVEFRGHCVFDEDCGLYFSVMKDRFYSLDLKGRKNFIEAYMKDENHENRYVEKIASSKLYLTNKRLIIYRISTLLKVISLKKIISIKVFDENSMLPRLDFETTLREDWGYWRHFSIRIPEAAKLKEAIARCRSEQIREIESEKRKVIVDFSTIRDLLQKGGIVLYTAKCPNCGALLELPESGNKTTCEHCGATVYAEDMLKKLRELL